MSPAPVVQRSLKDPQPRNNANCFARNNVHEKNNAYLIGWKRVNFNATRVQSSNTSEKTTDRIHPTGSCDFVAFKKFTHAYWHQIALEIMFLPMLAFFSPHPFSPSVLSPRLVINTHTQLRKLELWELMKWYDSSLMNLKPLIILIPWSTSFHNVEHYVNFFFQFLDLGRLRAVLAFWRSPSRELKKSISKNKINVSMPRGTLGVRRRKHFVRTFRAPLFQSSALAARQHQFFFFIIFIYYFFFWFCAKNFAEKQGLLIVYNLCDVWKGKW